MDHLKTLTLVRHGDYSGEDLTPYGKAQMQYMARQIQKRIEENAGRDHGYQITILTSSAPRAAKSARVIAETLGMSVSHTSERFWSDEKRPQNEGLFLEELENNVQKSEHVIVISHFEYLEAIPFSITQQMGFIEIASHRKRSKGAGVFLNMTRKRAIELPPA